MEIEIPDVLVGVARELEGGNEWLARLPSLVAELVGRWQLTLVDQLTGGVNSWVRGVVLPDGTDGVLKLPVPHAEGRHEIDGLPRVADEMAGHAVGVRAFAGRFPGVVADDDVDRAIATLGRGPEPDQHVFLHRDLHALNILDSKRGWLAVDPKPHAGPAYCDLGMALACGVPSVAQVPWLCGALGVDEDSTLGFAHAVTVTSALWNQAIGRADAAPELAARARLLAARR